LKNRQKVSGMASSRFSEEVVKATPLARKVMATGVSGCSRGDFGRHYSAW